MVSTMKLPEGWIVQTSKSHPNRVYYFNTRTNKASWELPIDEKPIPGISKATSKGKKRKPEDDPSVHRPVTPDLEVPKKTKASERRMLKAKRTLPPDRQNNEAAGNAGGSKSKETPQMLSLREKMLQRRAKGNAPRRTKITPVDAPPKVEEPSAEPTASTSSSTEARNLTPQMRVMLEKMKQRGSKIGPTRSPGRKSTVKTESKISPLRRPRTKSITAKSSDNENSPMTRRSTRYSVNAAATSKVKSKVEGAPAEKSSVPPTVLIRREIEIEMRGCSSPRTAETRYDRNANLPETAKTSKLSASQRKNIAEERLVNLQKSFSDEQSELDGPVSNEDDRSSEYGNILRLDDPTTITAINASPPSIYKNAEMRAKFLRERIHNKSLYQKKRPTFVHNVLSHAYEENNDPVVATNDFYEEMDWEPIEDDKIMQEIQVVRTHIGAIDHPMEDQIMLENSLDFPDGASTEKRKPSLYIVVDTNVFLSNIAAVEEARDAEFKNFGRPLIVIPWTVIRELDFIKDDKSMSRPECLRAKARQAVRFLNLHFSARHPRVLGQTPHDVRNNKEKFDVDCPDDEILQTCMQIRETANNVVLLSYDKNLCNKAMIHDLVTLGRNDPLEKVDYLHASDTQNDSFLTLHLRGEENDNVVPIYVKELRMAEELMEEAKDVLNSFMTVIVTKEMQNLYNDNWEKYTIIRPPWSVFAVLKCAMKHWIAAVSDSFVRRADPLIRELFEAINSVPDTGRKLTDISHILETINDLLQCVKVEKYPNVINQSARAIADLRVRCANATRKLYDEKIRDTYCAKSDTREDEVRAENAFKQFEDVYAFARDMCGLASDAIGMSCSFPYKKLNPEPTIESIKEMQPDVAANLNRLLQVLGTALEEINSLHVDHRAVEALYHALSTFMPDQKRHLERTFSPLDVYCCLKKKEKVLRLGLAQLQELSSHFCRMASFRCT